LETTPADGGARRHPASFVVLLVTGFLVVASICAAAWYVLAEVVPSLTDVASATEGTADLHRNGRPLESVMRALGGSMPRTVGPRSLSQEEEAALDQYTATVAAEPDSDAALYELALYERSVGRTDAAIEHLQQAATLNNDVAYVDDLARTYMQLGMYAEAAQAWGSIAEDSANDVGTKVAYMKLQSEALRSARENDAALDVLEAALRLAPRDSDLRALVAQYGK
jgi:tetratricopeptide (TPR) repeat protein